VLFQKKQQKTRGKEEEKEGKRAVERKSMRAIIHGQAGEGEGIVPRRSNINPKYNL
jgi:hypothetical protein